MSRVIAQVTLFRDGALPEDAIVNTYHFEDDGSGLQGSGGVAQNGPGLISRLVAFYQAIGTTWLAATLAGQGIVKLYDFADAKPRVVRLQETFTHPTATAAYPGEVALCLSMAASPVAGQSQARRRGRVFLGPLSSSVGGLGGNGADIRPDINSLNPILTAARTMARGGSGTYRLAVYSPTTFAINGDEDASWNDVETMWIDNAFDTIRKRGSAATARRTIQVSGTAAPV